MDGQKASNRDARTHLKMVLMKMLVGVPMLMLMHGKTEFIDFSKPSKRTPQSNLSLKIAGIEIKKVKESKFLGVFLDQNVTWRSHIKKVITKISQTVGIIGRARAFMDSSQLIMLYNTMVLPHQTKKKLLRGV